MDSGGHLARTTDREGSVRFGTGRKSVPTSLRLSSLWDFSLAGPSHFYMPHFRLVTRTRDFRLKSKKILSKSNQIWMRRPLLTGFPHFIHIQMASGSSGLQAMIFAKGPESPPAPRRPVWRACLGAALHPFAVAKCP